MERREGLKILIWIIRTEAKHNIAVGMHHEHISSHRDIRQWIAAIVCARFFLSSDDRLESVSVEMERMLSGISTVEDDFNDIVFLENECIRVGAINCRTSCCITGREHRIQSRDFGLDICDVIEESAGSRLGLNVSFGAVNNVLVRSIAEIVHLHLEIERIVHISEKLFLIGRNQRVIIKWIKLI